MRVQKFFTQIFSHSNFYYENFYTQKFADLQYKQTGNTTRHDTFHLLNSLLQYQLSEQKVKINAVYNVEVEQLTYSASITTATCVRP